MRNALELETTAQPAAANCGSSSRAIEESRAAKIIFGAPCGLGGRNRHLGDVGGDGSFQTPARGFGIRPAFRPIGSGKPCDFEPRMMLQHLNKSLADDAGGTENSYRKFVRHIG